jgi:hypothetical protein
MFDRLRTSSANLQKQTSVCAEVYVRMSVKHLKHPKSLTKYKLSRKAEAASRTVFFICRFAVAATRISLLNKQ